MKYLYPVVFLLLMGVCQQQGFSQDPEYSMFYANPLHLNPAMAGTEACPRLTLNYRYQWPSISGTYESMTAGYDQRAMKNIGLGFQLDSDQAGQATLNTNQVHLFYAYHNQLSHQYSFSFGFQATYRNKYVDKNKLHFPDEIHERYGFVKPTQENMSQINPVYLPDFSTGFLFYGNGMYLGGSVHHLFEPNESLIGGVSPLPRKYSLHGGMKVNKTRDSYWSPNFIWRAQQDFRYLFLGMYYHHDPITFGIWYRNLDAIILLLGVQNDNYFLGFSYDTTISKLGFNTGGATEFTFRYNFNCRPKKRKFRDTGCPSF